MKENRRKSRVLAIAVVVAVVLSIQPTIGASIDGTTGAGALPTFFIPKTCTALGVGKNATIDGSTICTQSADCGFCDFTIHYVPAADHEPGTTVPVRRWTQPTNGYQNKPGPIICEIPQVEHTYGYFRAIFGVMNEHGLAMGESTIFSRMELWPTVDSEAAFRITELSMIAMGGCTTAREAIKLMGSLAEEHGFHGTWAGESLMIADGDEVWLFEIHPSDPRWLKDSGKSGAVWCAQRVPDDGFVVVPNESVIGEIDLNNTGHFMASEDVFDVAIENGWWDPNSGEPFRWDVAYSDKKATGLRKWRALSMVAPSLDLKPYAEEYPFSVKPDKKLSLQDVREIHGDHLEGTEFDQTKGLPAGPWGCPNWPRPNPQVPSYRPKQSIAMMASEYVVINQVRGWLPDPIAGVAWWGVDDGDTTCYVPLYCGITELPKAYTVGNHHEFDPNSAFWVFNLVGNIAQLRYCDMIKEINQAQNRIEGVEIAMQEFVDARALELYTQDPALARQFLTTYCVTNANWVVDQWWFLLSDLLDKYDDGGSWNPWSPTPEWWCKAVTPKGDQQLPA